MGLYKNMKIRKDQGNLSKDERKAINEMMADSRRKRLDATFTLKWELWMKENNYKGQKLNI